MGSFLTSRSYTLSLEATTVYANGESGNLTMTVCGGGMAAAAINTFTIPARSTGGNTALPFTNYTLAFIPTSSVKHEFLRVRVDQS